MQQSRPFWFLLDIYGWVVLGMSIVTAFIIDQWWIVLLGVIGYLRAAPGPCAWRKLSRKTANCAPNKPACWAPSANGTRNSPLCQPGSKKRMPGFSKYAPHYLHK